MRERRKRERYGVKECIGRERYGVEREREQWERVMGLERGVGDRGMG